MHLRQRPHSSPQCAEMFAAILESPSWLQSRERLFMSAKSITHEALAPIDRLDCLNICFLTLCKQFDDFISKAAFQLDGTAIVEVSVSGRCAKRIAAEPFLRPIQPIQAPPLRLRATLDKLGMRCLPHAVA